MVQVHVPPREDRRPPGCVAGRGSSRYVANGGSLALEGRGGGPTGCMARRLLNLGPLSASRASILIGNVQREVALSRRNRGVDGQLHGRRAAARCASGHGSPRPAHLHRLVRDRPRSGLLAWAANFVVTISFLSIKNAIGGMGGVSPVRCPHPGRFALFLARGTGDQGQVPARA